ncbi:MAG: polysaccharide deacetylase family protein [Acidobacteria bacterium]|nr:polysaccharide deacetylase family protein [Acidobacteriota bacterium]
MFKKFRIAVLMGAGLLLSARFNPAAGVDRTPGEANELGKVMILEYHRIADKEDRWSRSVENFRNDLERFYRLGYRLIGLNDYIDGKINIPRGTSPLILTFDDSSPGQLRFKEGGREAVMDPDCAVGMLEAFNKVHPDFGLKATFFVLPAAAQPHKLFGQPEFEKQKLQYLATHGFEIGNHTLWHANLGKYDEPTIRKQLAFSVKIIRALVPGYRVRALALPFGVYPKVLDVAVRGAFDGFEYYHEAILRVSGGPAHSPYHKACDLLHLPRIQATNTELNYWLNHFEQKPGERFISDGNPYEITFPMERQNEFNRTKFEKFRVNHSKTGK